MPREVSSEPYRPWFRTRPGLALASAVALFVAVTVLRIGTGDDAIPGITMLYVLPVSLVALSWGRRAGIGSGLVAVGLGALWDMTGGVDVSPMGWVSRAVPLLLVGFLLGDASDRLRRAEVEHLGFEAQELLRRQAADVNDTLVQGMVAAKWALECGNVDAGVRMLTTTLRTGQELVSDLMRRSDAAHATRAAGVAGPSHVVLPALTGRTARRNLVGDSGEEP